MKSGDLFNDRFVIFQSVGVEPHWWHYVYSQVRPYSAVNVFSLITVGIQGPWSCLVSATWRLVMVMLEIGLLKALVLPWDWADLRFFTDTQWRLSQHCSGTTVTVKTPAAACVHSAGDTQSDLPSYSCFLFLYRTARFFFEKWSKVTGKSGKSERKSWKDNLKKKQMLRFCTNRSKLYLKVFFFLALCCCGSD